MMRAALVALVFAPPFAFAQSAEIWREADTDAIALVQSTCVAHSANAIAIATDLATRGWREISAEERRRRDPENVGGGFVMHWTNSQTWAPQDGSALTLVLGDGPLGQGEAHADFCMIIEQAPFSQQVRGVRRWLGFRRFQTWGPGGDNFAYVRDAAGNLSNGADISDEVRDAALREGRFGFIQVVGDRTTSVVNFSALRPVEPPSEEGAQ